MGPTVPPPWQSPLVLLVSVQELDHLFYEGSKIFSKQAFGRYRRDITQIECGLHNPLAASQRKSVKSAIRTAIGDVAYKVGFDHSLPT